MVLCIGLDCFLIRGIVFAQPTIGEPNQNQQKTQKSLTFIKVADFYLRDGGFINGRLIEDDKNKITVERKSGDTLVVETYGKKEIDARTLNIKSTLEYNYYVLLGDYFAAKTWDFENDPDDFIQAIRSYEKALLLLSGTSRADDKVVDDITQKIAKLNADREVWTEQTKTRAELKRLEFEATFEEKFDKLAQQVDLGTEKVDAQVEKFANIADQLTQSNEALRKDFDTTSYNLASRMGRLETRLEDTRGMFYYRNYYYPVYPQRRDHNDIDKK